MRIRLTNCADSCGIIEQSKRVEVSERATPFPHTSETVNQVNNKQSPSK